MKTSVNIRETHDAMSEILHGDREPSVLLAYWASALSSRMRLHLNCKYVRVLAQFVETGLPDRETLLLAMGRAWGKKYPQGIMGSHIDLLYRLEHLHSLGLLNFDAGETLESQQAWRARMVALIPGMGCKLISWALFIFNPLYCKLLAVDCWHCLRLGIDQSKISGSSSKQIAAYHAAEKRMLAECLALYPEYPPVVTAAMLWENIRIANFASQGESYQSHAALSCRWY